MAEGQTVVVPLKVGDHVLLRKPPASLRTVHGLGDESVSSKLMPLTSSQVFEIYKITGASDVIMCDLDTRSTELGFSQPVAIERLVAFDLCNLEVPIGVDSPVILELRTGPNDE